MAARKRGNKVGLLIDTNVLLDIVLERSPWAPDAALVLDAISRGKARGFMAGHAVTTLYYVVEKEAGRAAANTAVADLIQLVSLVAIGAAELQRAFAMGLGDFEDAVQAAACLSVGADYLVTRNGKDFKAAPVMTRTPGEVLASLV